MLRTEIADWVVEVDGCHLWQRPLINDGYARATFEGRSQMVHRVAWEVANGRTVPQGHDVDHTCFSRACVNPDHLRLLSISANRRLQRSSFKTHCIHGHEFTPANTYQRLSGGQRQCRACNSAAAARYAARRKAAA
jgi:hypothetical protein